MRRVPFRPDRLEVDWQFKQGLSERIHDRVVTSFVGNLRPRVKSIKVIRGCLVEGELPDLDALSWPAPDVAARVFAELGKLGNARVLRGDQKEVDETILALLDLIEQFERDAAREEAEALRGEEDEQEEDQDHADLEPENRGENDGGAEDTGSSRDRAGDEERPSDTESDGGEEARGDNDVSGSDAAKGADSEGGRPEDRGGDGEESEEGTREQANRQLRRQQREALKAAARRRALDRLVEAMHARWGDLAELWSKALEVFGDLGALASLDRDFALRMLRSSGWAKVQEMRARLERLPALQRLIRALGRLRTSETPGEESVSKVILGPTRRVLLELRETWSPEAVGEVRGIELSAQLERMLPSEAALLAEDSDPDSPLEYLFYAKLAEQRLVTYSVEGVEVEAIYGDEPTRQTVHEPAPRKERGPIIVCLDTSGSMQFDNRTPETVAKALTLEAMIVARKERRRCYLYAFGGPGQVEERELSLDGSGIEAITRLLEMEFNKGTDIGGPLERASRLLQTSDWVGADLLVVSDGDFEVPAAAKAAINEARKNAAAMVHGVLVSRTVDADSMRNLCDPGCLHRFTDWHGLLAGA